MKCVVPFCENFLQNVWSQDITFHPLPTEPCIRTAWCQAICKEESELQPSEQAFICSQHFLIEDIYQTRNGLKKVRPGAMPLITQVCLICLNTTRKLYSLNEHMLQEAYENLIGLPLRDGDHFPRTLCAECRQRLINCSRFRDKSLKAHSLLIELIREHGMLTVRSMKMLNSDKNQLASNLAQKMFTSDHYDLYVLEKTPDNEAKLHKSTHEMCDNVNVKIEVDDYSAKEYQQDCSNHRYNEAHIVAKEEPSDDCVSEKLNFQIKEERNDTDVITSHHIEVQLEPFINDVSSSQTTSSCPIKVEYNTPKDDAEICDYSSTTYGNEDDNPTLPLKETNTNKKLLRKLVDANRYKNSEHNLDRDKIRYQQNEFSAETPVDKQYSCNMCKYRCKRSDALREHMRSHSGVKAFTCDICQKSLVSKSTLVKHMRCHTGEKPFSCDLCTYKCSQKHHLKAHMMSHTGEKLFSCNICEYKCNYSSHLKVHMRLHSGEKLFSCSVCQYKCNYSSHMKVHMRLHTGEKLFSCNICDYKCNYSSYLKVHMRLHTGEKPFYCTVCDYKCSRSNILALHMKTHSEEPPFCCKVCDYTCSRSNQLASHMKMHINEKPYNCDNCQKKFAYKGALVSHMRRHAGEKHVDSSF